MATFIFDFDDTLFNAQELKRIIFNKLKEYGTSHESVERTYKELRTTKENYNLSFHRDELNTTHDFLIPETINEWFSEINFEQYLFPETRGLLEDLLSHNHTLILLTQGEAEYQNIKIKGTNISKYFQDIFIVENEKEIFLQNLTLTYPVYFINDKNSENNKIKILFPEIIVIEKKEDEPLGPLLLNL